MAAIIEAAATQGLWIELVPLIEVLPDDARTRLPKIAEQLKPELLQRILGDAANAPDTLPTLLAIVKEMGEAGRANVVNAIDAADEQIGNDLLRALADPAGAASWLAQLQPEIQAAVGRAADRFGMEDELQQALAEAN